MLNKIYLETFQIHISGKVQGIGFRPFVYALAVRMGLNGIVSNEHDGVHIRVNAGSDVVAEFVKHIKQEAPEASFIREIKIARIAPETFPDFKIIQSYSTGETTVLITPDLSMCADCSKEIHLEYDVRFCHAFTTCTNCGPRFSILTKLPFERENTTMHDFKMCDQCSAEYNNTNDRRFWSQTNSCPECGPALQLYNNEKELLSERPEHIFNIVKSALSDGKIIAVKGIGGYLLLTDAARVESVVKMRIRKNRPSKPFAVMYPDLETLEKDAKLSVRERAALCGMECPVTIVNFIKNPASGILKDLIAPGLQKMGVLLPYAPIFEIILSDFGKPVIATSANISGNVILHNDKNAMEFLPGLADLIITHNREINIPLDDSVIKFSDRFQQKIILRRSRGYAPSADLLPAPSDLKLLATGSDLKSTFSIVANNNIYISQYLGNLMNYENLKNFTHNISNLEKLLNINSYEAILSDKHPGYISSEIGFSIADNLKIPHIKVQHHEAHFSAVIGENDLTDTIEPVLGVIWDGLGYGHDGKMRGGEFIRYDHHCFSPVSEIAFFQHVAGDKFAEDPRLCALSVCLQMPEAEQILRPAFSKKEWYIYTTLLSNNEQVSTNSTGRIFDAIAFLLGFRDKQSYEGEAAAWLETLAASDSDIFQLTGYNFPSDKNTSIGIIPVIRQIVNEINSGIPAERIAARFHITLVDLIKKTAAETECRHICFSGGVFQNGLLIDLIIEKMKTEFQLYFHQHLSPNDECISFGQLHWMEIQKKAASGKADLYSINYKTI